MDDIEQTVVKPADQSQDGIVADPVDVGGKSVPTYGPDPVLRRRELLGLDKLDAAGKEQEALAGKQSAAMAPEYDKMKGMLDQPRPELKLQQPPDAPDTRKQDVEQYQKYMMPMLIFAAVLSKVAGADMTQGLNALSSGLVGMRMGRDEVAKQSIETWKAKMESVREQNQALMDQYRAIMDDRKMGMQEQQMRMGLIAQQNGDAMMLSQIKEKGAIAGLQRLDAMQKQQEKFDAQNANMDRLVTRMQDQLMRQREHDQTLTAIAGIRGQTAENVAETNAVSRERVASQRQTAINERKTAKEKSALEGLQTSVKDIDRLLDQVDKNPGIAGAYGYVNRFTEMVAGYTGKTIEGDNPATRFRTSMNLLQAHLTKAAYAGRISNYEIKKMEDTIGGIGITDSPAQVSSKLREVKEILQAHAGQMEEESEPFYDSPEDVSKAVKSGKVKPGDTVQTPWGPYKAK